MAQVQATNISLVEGIEDCLLGRGVLIYNPKLVNLYGCIIGQFTTIAPFVEIQRGASIGQDCKICTHAFICGSVILHDRVFVGHGVMFCNDDYPVIGGPAHLAGTVVEDDVSIGSGAVILPGLRIGKGTIIGAGAVVVHDVPALSIVAGNPAKLVRQFSNFKERWTYLCQKSAC